MRRTIKRGLALAGVASLTLTASLLATPASARAELPAKPPAATTVSHDNVLSAEVTKLMKGSGVQAETKALEAYWTPKRMKEAKSIDRTGTLTRAGEAPRRNAQTKPEGAAGSVAPFKTKAPAAMAGVSPQVSQPGLPSEHPAARTNGKVFFSRGGGNYVCSASIVNSEGKSLVWTAGHCLADNATWSTNVTFVPAYSSGDRPYGTWSAGNLTTLSDWFYDRDWASDVGAMTMYRNADSRIADYFGAQGIAWNQSASYTAAAFGYPAASPYNGQYLYRADGSTTDEGDNTIYMYSGMTGGSSGGPWFRDFDGSWGTVNGHNDFIYTAQPLWMYSPYYGNQVAGLYNAVRYDEAKRSLTTATPTISGTAKVGKVLTAKPGSWKPAPVTFKYQWYIKSGTKSTTISGATKSTLKVPAAAKGKTITVKVTGSKVGYKTASKTSKATKKVVAGSLVGKTPTISGTAKVGKTLTAKPGVWSPASVSLSYQWYRNGVKITNAKSLTYKLVKADKGKKITIKVTGKKSGYTTLTKTSKQTATVK